MPSSALFVQIRLCTFFFFLSGRRRGCGGAHTTCQVERRRRRLRQPVLIRYQISEVSESRRPGAALLLLRHVASVSCKTPAGPARGGAPPPLNFGDASLNSSPSFCQHNAERRQQDQLLFVTRVLPFYLFHNLFFRVTHILIETAKWEEFMHDAASTATRWHLWHCLKEPVKESILKVCFT